MKLALKILATVEDDDDDDDGADIIIVLSPRKKVSPGNMSEAPLIDQSMRINWHGGLVCNGSETVGRRKRRNDEAGGHFPRGDKCGDFVGKGGLQVDEEAV